MKVTNKALATVFLLAGAGVDAASTIKSAVAGLALLSAGVHACLGQACITQNNCCEGYTCCLLNDPIGGGSRPGCCTDFGSGPGPSPPRDKSTPIASAKVVGSDAGYCEGIADRGIANTTAGCDANYVLNAAVYPDGSVKGKAVDVFALAVDLFGLADNGAILVAGDVSCLNFFEVADGEDAGSYAVASGIIEQGPEIILNLPYVSAAKINSTGSFYYRGYGFGDPNVTCDDFDETFLSSSRFKSPHKTGTFEINPPVAASEGCDELNVKQCRKTNGCKWVGDQDVGECVSKDDDGFGLLRTNSLAQEEAPVTKAEMKEESNSSNRAGLKMMSGMLVGLFLAMWDV